MSNFLLSSRNNNKQEINEPDELLNQGVEKIYQSFEINSNRYKEKISEQENIISNIKEKLEMLNKEIEMIQRENQYYKTQNEQQKVEIDKLNKIIKNIKGKLTSVDFEINDVRKTDNPNIYKKNFDQNRKKKNNNILIGLKNKNNIDSLFQLNSKNYMKNKKNENYTNKNTKNKKLMNFLDINNNFINNCLKKNYDNNANNLKKKFNKTSNYNSFDLNFNNINNNNNLYKNNEKFHIRTKNSLLYNEFIGSEEVKNNNIERAREEDIDSFTIRQKDRCHSTQQYLKQNKNFFNNKTSDDVQLNNNFEDLNINPIFKKENEKEFDGQICYTYDSYKLLNKNNANKKRSCNSFNSFRGKLFNKNIFKHYDLKKNKIDNELLKKICNEDNFKQLKSDEITYFLKKCKNLLEKESFEQIVKIFFEYKDGLITDEGIILKTQEHLENNKELIELFNKIFFNKV